ncbi:hypothetical protein ACJW30_04G022700 [Castanea mollissima]
MSSFVLSEADQAFGEPSQTKDNIGMEPVYYNAAAEGKIEVFEDIPKPLKLNQLLTSNRNTVLHIYLTSLIKESESSKAFVKEILKMCSTLLCQANVKDETPLHIAARYGHAAIVEVLIEHAKGRQQDLQSAAKVAKSAPQPDLESGVNNKAVKEMLKMKNEENETAMHEAVRNNHLEVVKLLVKNGKDISYSANDAGETPLYMAVERNYRKVVFHILENCTSLTHDGPLGGTTLHAAVIWNDDVMTGEIQKKIERKALAQKYNQRLTPLHCAAYFNCYSAIKILLKNDRSMAYKKDTKDMTALHIAADRGHVKIVNEILKYCPDCSELVDKRGWNALHFAVNSSHKDVVNVILNQPSLSNLLNEKDERGNTPLLHSKSLPCIKDLMRHDRVNKMAFNEQNLDAYDIALTTNEELSKEKESVNQRSATMFQRSKSCPVKFGDNEIAFPRNNRPAEFRKFLGEQYIKPKNFLFGLLQWEEEAYNRRKDRFISIMKETSQYHLVVDTLIATVTFAAGITMPGGFIGQEGPHSGSPVLIRNSAFKAFIITNSIAMVQSCSASFIHLFMPLLFHEQNFEAISLAYSLSISAMIAMVLAFFLGIYAVLMPSLGLAIATSVIGLLFFITINLVNWIFFGLSNFLDFHFILRHYKSI